MSEHISKQFDAELAGTCAPRPAEWDGLVEEQIRRAADTLVTGDMAEIAAVQGKTTIA